MVLALSLLENIQLQRGDFPPRTIPTDNSLMDNFHSGNTQYFEFCFGIYMYIIFSQVTADDFSSSAFT